MSSKTLVLIGMIVVVGVISAAIAYLRVGSMSQPEEIASKGLASVRKSALIFYGVFLPVVVGVISWYVFRFMNARWPATAETNYLILATAIAVAFTVMAAVVFKMRGFTEFTVLHILYVVGFGWVMPRVLAL